MGELQDKMANDIIDEVIVAERSWRDVVRVGDRVDSTQDRRFTFSNVKYVTKGKLYKVRALAFRPEYHSYTVVVDSDVEGEIAYVGMGTVIVRKGVIVWNWVEAVQGMYDKAKEMES